MADSFTCAKCGGTFPKGWTDAEADAEQKQAFPQFSVEECELVCDDCYKEFMELFNANQKA